jgi:hypothetical protein
MAYSYFFIHDVHKILQCLMVNCNNNLFRYRKGFILGVLSFTPVQSMYGIFCSDSLFILEPSVYFLGPRYRDETLSCTSLHCQPRTKGG